MVDDNLRFCKKMLNKVSRSFALTIPMLDDILYKPVMVTYLIDRLLDNFEDEVKGISLEKKKYLMKQVVAVFDPSNSSPQIAIQTVEESADLIGDQSLAKLTAGAGKVYLVFSKFDREIQEIQPTGCRR